MLGEGVTIGADNVVANGARVFPGVTHPRRRHPLLDGLALDAAACAAVDSTGQIAETLGLAEHLRDALWRVDSAGIAPVDAPGGLIVAGMGGSAVGGRLAAGALGPRLRRPLALAMDYDIPAWIGGDDARAVLELLRRHRGDARRVRRGQGGGRAAHRRDDRRPARRARARRRRAGRAASRRLPAARGGRLLARHRARGARACAAPRRRCATRSRPPPRWPPSSPREWGPGRRRGQRGQARSRARCTARSR